MQKNKKIPIVFAIDTVYINILLVVFESILNKSSCKNLFEFIVLVPSNDNLCEYDELKVIENKYPNSSVRIIPIDDSVFGNVKANNYKNIVFYRLLIPELLPEYDKVVYLDADIIVNLDIGHLYRKNIENYYIAGSIDRCISNTHFFKTCIGNDEYRVTKDIYHFLTRYINAGVLLFNLKSIREAFLQNIFIQSIMQNYCFNDQDILNIVCKEKIKILPDKYNLFNKCTRKIIPCIMHYPGSIKPWQSLKCAYGDIWWKNAEKVLSKSVLDDYRKKTEKNDQKMDFSELFKKLPSDKKIVVWGFTQSGRKLAQFLRNNNLNVLGFCDNSVEKQQQKEVALPVKGFDYYINEPDNYFFINMVKKSKVEVDDILTDAKIEHTDFQLKDIVYFSSLDKKFYKHEINEIKLMYNCSHKTAKRMFNDLILASKEV